MNSAIQKILDNIEESYDVRILYAVEAGSRVWGLSTDASDYDIRFVYAYNDHKTYLRLKPYNETIQGFSASRMFDWQGWDIKKALKLMSNLNPSIVEWVYSTIVYRTESNFDFRACAQKLIEQQHRVLPLIKHYTSTAKSGTFDTPLTRKKYVNCIRAACMAEWFLQGNKIGSLNIRDILTRLNLDAPLTLDIERAYNTAEFVRSESIDNWIQSVIQRKFLPET